MKCVMEIEHKLFSLNKIPTYFDSFKYHKSTTKKTILVVEFNIYAMIIFFKINLFLKQLRY